MKTVDSSSLFKILRTHKGKAYVSIRFTKGVSVAVEKTDLMSILKRDTENLDSWTIDLCESGLFIEYNSDIFKGE